MPLLEMKQRVSRDGQIHEVLLREVSYEVILPPEERIRQLFDESDTKEEFVEKAKEEGLI
jgi:hypothetical protein